MTTLYFSYNQFMVHDATVLPGLLWTEQHYLQGFSRRESIVCFGTLAEFGHADLEVISGVYQPLPEYERVISVPFYCSSGKVRVQGPEEEKRVFDIAIGHYRLTAAQILESEDEEIIDLFFEAISTPLGHSEIIVADEELNPFYPLVESAEDP